MDAESTSRTLQAGSLRVDLAARRAFTGGRELELEPLVFDLLGALAARPGEVVTKDALWQDVWQARPVSDSVIPHAVSKLRRALESAGAPEQVLAVHGRGYRLALTAATTPASTATPQAAPATQLAASRTLLHTALVLLAIAVAAVAVALLVGLPASPQARPERVALLPLENATGDPSLDWAEVGLLPRSHGSALFARGWTKASRTQAWTWSPAARCWARCGAIRTRRRRNARAGWRAAAVPSACWRFA